MNLLQKYSPITINEIILNEKISDAIIAWANGWLQGFPSTTTPAIIFYGKPGTGKTLTARCIAKDCEWNLIELNASSVRTKEQLMSLLNIPPTDFFGRKNCLFLDEIDSSDSGEVVIKKVITNMKFPVILAGNDLYKIPKMLRDVSEPPIQFFRPSVKVLKQQILKINREEGLCLPIELIDAISNLQDYRAAYESMEARQILQNKEKKMSLSDITKNLFNNEDVKLEDTKSLSYYIEENVGKLYDILDLYEIFETTIKFDKYNKRGQEKFANLLIKEIPKTTLDIEEIKKSVYFEKLKNQKKFEPT